jgi:hypothetical protein
MHPTFTRQQAADAVAKATGDPLGGQVNPATADRWTRLSSELDLLERELASVAGNYRDTERTVAQLLHQRDELRGLLSADKAKAARLGAAEDPHLAARYDRARELLRTAPCDLNAATDAVNGYQQAVLAIGAQRL